MLWISFSVVLVTDGLSNINSEVTVKAAQLLKDTGAHIFTIGVGLTDNWEAKAMATEPANLNSFDIQDFEALPSIREDLVSAICIGESEFIIDSGPRGGLHF